MDVETILEPGPTRVMGIVNVTTDSFADDVHRSVMQAIDFGIEMAGEGADIIDIGGESTRPGAERVSESEEMARVIPVAEALAGSGIAVSVDTVRANVARAALHAGALIINDVSGGVADPEILNVVAEAGAGYVLQHWRTPFDHRPTHVHVVDEVCTELTHRLDIALAAGIEQEKIILDPGIGFGKTPSQNWELLACAPTIAELGYPVLWGVSRKRFLAEAYPRPTEPWQRDAATIAVTTLLAEQRVWAVRTHTIAENRAAIWVAEAILNAADPFSTSSNVHPSCSARNVGKCTQRGPEMYIFQHFSPGEERKQ